MKHRKPRRAAWPRNRRLNLAVWMIIAGCATLTTIAAVKIADQLKSDVEKQPTIDGKIEYLKTILSDEQARINAATARKAEALKLLGQTAATTSNTAIVSNAVEVLVSDIAFDGKDRGSEPAAEGLSYLGERAVPRLLRVFEESQEAITIHAAAQALAEIKGLRYEDFVKAQKDKMSPEAWRRLSMSPVVTF